MEPDLEREGLALIFLPTAREVQIPRRDPSWCPRPPPRYSSYLAMDLTAGMGRIDLARWALGHACGRWGGGDFPRMKCPAPPREVQVSILLTRRAPWAAATVACRAQFMGRQEEGKLALGCPPPHPEATQARFLGLRRTSREGHYLAITRPVKIS